MIGQDRDFKGVRGEWHVTIKLKDNKLLIQTVSDVSMETYETEMNQQKIKSDKNFDFLFDSVPTLFGFLQTSFSQLTIKAGLISFTMEVPLGKLTKKMELTIATNPKQVDQEMLRELKLKKLQTQLQSLKDQNGEIKAKLHQSQQKMVNLTQLFKKFQRTLQQKDEVINSIFVQLKEIRQWKQQRQIEENIKLKRKFIMDDLNPHNDMFIQMGNRYKKSGASSWHLLMCKNVIEKNDLYRYTMRQIRAGSGGSFMYGIGTVGIRGVIRAQDNRQFIGYYENTGNVYDRGESRKGGQRIKDGDIIVMEVDTKNWYISWEIDEKRIDIPIMGEMRVKPIYLSIVIYNQDAELQFL